MFFFASFWGIFIPLLFHHHLGIDPLQLGKSPWDRGSWRSSRPWNVPGAPKPKRAFLGLEPGGGIFPEGLGAWTCRDDIPAFQGFFFLGPLTGTNTPFAWLFWLLKLAWNSVCGSFGTSTMCRLTPNLTLLRLVLIPTSCACWRVTRPLEMELLLLLLHLWSSVLGGQKNAQTAKNNWPRLVWAGLQRWRCACPGVLWWFHPLRPLCSGTP